MKISDFKQINNSMRFHMPGHSGIDIGINSTDDITELSYSDNLLSPKDAIADVESKVAAIYGAKHALIFTNGATSAINAVLLSLKQKFEHPVIKTTGSTHKSTEQYIAIHGLEKKDRFNILFHTSPDYYGRYISAEKGDFLTVLDASHASHYAFSDRLPVISPDDYDIIIYSLHKTLPVLTGGAAAVTNDDETYSRLCLARSYTHSTSPSYMTIASIDMAADALIRNGSADYENVYSLVNDFIAECKYKSYFYNDFTRLTIDLEGKNADELNKYLEEHGAYMEMVRGDKILLIVTPYNAIRLKELNALINASPSPGHILTASAPPVAVIDPNAPKIGVIELLSPQSAVGKTSACEIGLYPPGTAIVTSGQIITGEVIDFINEYADSVFGLISGKIPVFNSGKESWR